jgi:hypothetical protein
MAWSYIYNCRQRIVIEAIFKNKLLKKTLFSFEKEHQTSIKLIYTHLNKKSVFNQIVNNTGRRILANLNQPHEQEKKVRIKPKLSGEKTVTIQSIDGLDKDSPQIT